jgi:hypothetical protein
MRFSISGNPAGERPVAAVPMIIKAGLVCGLILQVMIHTATSELQTKSEPLPEPLSNEFLDVLSLGEQVSMAKLLMLWVQGFDHQPGISIPFAQLDYVNLTGWLDRILTLDPDSHYALLSAARIYSEVPDRDKKIRMLEFVYNKFLENPEERWQWMAHAVHVAKHKMHDKDLALKYARELRLRTTSETAPEWARQLELFVHEDFGDSESAKILLGGLIESGEITSKKEIDFLMSRLGLKDSD